MRILTLDHVVPRARRVAVGEFDGVHLGHREVIRGSDTVLTFDPHPRQVINPAAAPKLLTPLATKARLVQALGVDELVVVRFDRAFADRGAGEFVDDVLVGGLGAVEVSVGENFRFGHRAGGDPALLQADRRFHTRVVALVECAGEVVSSSRIRGLLAAGDVELAARFLGAAFSLAGPVVEGDRRGRALGFPTANLVPDDRYAFPGHGVYACRAAVGEGPATLPAAVNVGVRPTFETGRGVLVEAHLIDWDGDLYGRELRLEFLSRLRGERRFDSVAELVEQMGRDVESARAVCAGSATVIGS